MIQAAEPALVLTPPDQLKKMYILRRILNPMGTMDAIENGLAHAEKYFSGVVAEKGSAKKLAR